MTTHTRPPLPAIDPVPLADDLSRPIDDVVPVVRWRCKTGMVWRNANPGADPQRIEWQLSVASRYRAEEDINS